MRHKNNLILLKIVGVVEMLIGLTLLWWGWGLEGKYWYITVSSMFLIASGRSWYFAHCIYNTKYSPRAK